MKKIKFNCGTSTCRYVVFGFLFGCCFPIVAISFDLIIYLGLDLTLNNIIMIHDENPIHYIIDTAPIFLGVAFGVAGYYQEKARILNRSLSKEARNLERANENLVKALTDYHAAQDLLVKSEKLASLGQLTAGIAHEMRNPLNFINNFSESGFDLIDELIAEKNEEERKEVIEILRGNFEKINRHGKKANQILENMMMLARSGKVEKRESDINEVSSDAADIAYHGMSSTIIGFKCDFKKNLGHDLPKIVIVYEDISRVVLNLLTNAFYAVNKRKEKEKNDYNATVTLTTGINRSSQQPEKDCILITVRDNGTGIPANVIEQIFNPFFTTKPSGEGTGLGLSISHDIILVHGGEMSVTSEENVFTEFRITLPINSTNKIKSQDNSILKKRQRVT